MSKKRKIALVFGTRPEAIKQAPVLKELLRRGDKFEPLVWITSQHREMLDQIMDVFEMKADRDFELMRPNQSLARLTASALEALEQAFEQERPDCVLVQGDTTTVFATALAAFYAKIPVGHIEAGLRTNNKHSPFPEEINRRLATRLADFHFAPTESARQNLLNDQVEPQRIWVTGNTVIDALDITIKMVRQNRPELPGDFPLKELRSARRMVLITGHRRENFGEGFESICHAIARLSEKHPEALFVYPVHLNPNVQEPVFRLLSGRDNVRLIAPLDYRAFVWAMDRAYWILTDSGGVQEEAPHLGKPVLVMRDTTERPEGIEEGTARLVGVDSETILREGSRLMENREAYEKMSQARNPYGDGMAAGRIVDALESVKM